MQIIHPKTPVLVAVGPGLNSLASLRSSSFQEKSLRHHPVAGWDTDTHSPVARNFYQVRGHPDEKVALMGVPNQADLEASHRQTPAEQAIEF